MSGRECKIVLTSQAGNFCLVELSIPQSSGNYHYMLNVEYASSDISDVIQFRPITTSGIISSSGDIKDFWTTLIVEQININKHNVDTTFYLEYYASLFSDAHDFAKRANKYVDENNWRSF